MTAPYRTAVSGERLADRYELSSHIDSGGMAEVWEATDHTLGRTVAVKILHAHLARDAAFLRRFRREAINAARLQHPTIVAIYDAVSYDGLEAIVMERIEGRTLRSVLDEHRRLPARDVIELASQISQALAVAHAAGVIHRDIKPSNIMLCEDRRIRVTDFGIAKAGEDTDLTRTGSLLGTAKYLSPEQVLGHEVDDRSDLYGLGIVMFEALAGRPPFDEGHDYATAQARVVAPAPRLSQFRPDLPTELDSLVARLLEQDPSDRPDSAMELTVLLAAITVTSEDLAPQSTNGDKTTIDLRSSMGRRGPSLDGDSTGEFLMETPTKQTKKGRRQQSTAASARPPEPTPEATGRATDSPTTFITRPLASGAPVPPGLSDRLAAEEPSDEPLTSGFRMPMGRLLAVLLALGTLLLATALITRFNGDSPSSGPDNGDDASESLTGETVSLTPVQDFGPPEIQSGAAVDPFANDGENDALAPLAIDGDPSTFWPTEDYSSPGFAGVKPAVGYLVTLVEDAAPSTLEMLTPTQNWSAEVYVGDLESSNPDDFTFGPFALEPTEDGGETDLGEATGRYVLVWITFEGTTVSADSGDGENRFVLAEVIIE